MSQQILFYDGDCSLCQRSVQYLDKLRLLDQVQALPWGEIECHHPIVAERIHWEIILWNPQTDHYRGGIDAILALMRQNPQWQWLVGILKIPPLHWCLKQLYFMISVNRRLLAPTQKIPCACDPPKHMGYQIAFFILLLLILLFFIICCFVLFN